jgi:hypothetical protein
VHIGHGAPIAASEADGKKRGKLRNFTLNASFWWGQRTPEETKATDARAHFVSIVAFGRSESRRACRHLHHAKQK